MKPVQKSTIVVLDGVRAIACLLVIVYHINVWANFEHIWIPEATHPLIRALALVGWTGVSLFFILSGFLLFMPYAKSLLFGSQWPSARHFYLRRALRIMPGYYASLGLIILMLHPEYLQPERWRELVLFLTFLMDSDTATFQELNGPYWTLAVEWQFYMLLPLLALGLRRVVERFEQRWRIRVLIVCLGGMVVWGVFSRYWGIYFFENPQESVLVPRPFFNFILSAFYGVEGKFFENFAIGMLVCLCYVYSRNAAQNHWLSARLRRNSHWLGIAGLILFLFITICPIVPYLSFLEPVLGRKKVLVELGYSLAFGLCILALLFGTSEFKRPLEWKPLCWIELISYSLYIWHLPVIISFTDYIIPAIRTWHGAILYSLFYVCAALVIFPLSYAFYRLIEVPWMQAGNRWNNKKLQEGKEVFSLQEDKSSALARR